jgi:hypothetical protein
VVVLDHLQEDEARGEQAEADQHQHAGDADAQVEPRQLALVIPELCHG